MKKYESQESFDNDKEFEAMDSFSDPSLSILNPINKATLPIGLFTPEMIGNASTPVNRLPPPIARQRPTRIVHRRMSTLSSPGVQTRRTRNRGMYYFFRCFKILKRN